MAVGMLRTVWSYRGFILGSVNANFNRVPEFPVGRGMDRP